jgi:hypothetical protein
VGVVVAAFWWLWLGCGRRVGEMGVFLIPTPVEMC